MKLHNFGLFLFRQIYRVFFVWPFQLVVVIGSLFDGNKQSASREIAEYCFIITSVIFPKQGKLIQYNGPRSIFSPEDRARQTQLTIDSIYSRISGAKIIFLVT